MLEFKDVTLHSDGNCIVQKLSLIARDGQVTCLTGGSKESRSMVLRAMLGLLPLTSGFLSIDGELVTPLSAHVFRREVAYLPPGMNRLANQLHKPEAAEQEADDYAVWDALLPKPVTMESAPLLGSADTLLLIRETLGQPGKRMVIADSPTDGLERAEAEAVTDLLTGAAAAGQTVIVASDDPLIHACTQLLIQI